MEKQSITALMSCFGRAYHAENEQHPVFRDTLAKQLLTAEEYEAVAGYILSGAAFFDPALAAQDARPEEVLRRLINGSIAPSPLCRAAWAERALQGSGAQQYVLLGAGLDTFAFRERGLRVFEVDHPLTQADKKRRISRAGWAAAENLTFVPADLAADDLTQRLGAAGFARGERAFFSWLGVTYYLTEEAIGRTLDALAALCVPGSLLAFDYPDEGFFAASERRVQCTVQMAAAGGEPMRSSFSRAALEKLLAAHGFRIRELLTPADIQQNILDAAGAELTAFEHVNYCLAAREN